MVRSDGTVTSVPDTVGLWTFVAGVVGAFLLPVVVLLPLALGPRPAAPHGSASSGAQGTAPEVVAPSRGGLLQPAPAVARTTTRNVFTPLVSHRVVLPGTGTSAGAAVEQGLGDWAWVGTAEMGAATYALMQNRKSRASTLVKAGDTFEGGVVQSVGSSALLVRVGEKLTSVALSSGDQPVSVAAAPPAGAPPGAPGAPPGAPGTPPPGGPASPQPAVAGAPTSAQPPPPVVLKSAVISGRVSKSSGGLALCKVGSVTGSFGVMVRVPEASVRLGLVTARGYDGPSRHYTCEDARGMVRRESPLLALSAVFYDTRSKGLIAPAFSEGRVLMRNPTVGTVVTWGGTGLEFHDRGAAMSGAASVAFAGVGPRILRGGKPVASPPSEGMPNVPAYATRRVVLGRDGAGNVCFGVVRAGITIPVAAAIAKRHGLIDAVLLDGGRSATFYLRSLGFVVRHTEDRPATNLLMVWARRPNLQPKVEVLPWWEGKQKAA